MGLTAKFIKWAAGQLTGWPSCSLPGAQRDREHIIIIIIIIHILLIIIIMNTIIDNNILASSFLLDASKIKETSHRTSTLRCS